MHTLTEDELGRLPGQLLEDARRGEPTLITVGGKAVVMAIPLGRGLATGEVRLELAAGLYDADQISLGLAARIAGLGYAEMIDELGRRGIATIRLDSGELERELAAFER